MTMDKQLTNAQLSKSMNQLCPLRRAIRLCPLRRAIRLCTLAIWQQLHTCKYCNVHTSHPTNFQKVTVINSDVMTQLNAIAFNYITVNIETK